MSTTRALFGNTSNDIKLSIEQLAGQVLKLTADALVCVSDQLCWAAGGVVTPITSPPELFARINHFADIDWRRNAVTKEEFYAGARHYVPRHDWSSDSPHFPPLPRVLYPSPPPRAANTGRLDELVGRFTPASESDRALMTAFIMTLFWGGPCGKRPMFTVTADAEGDSHRGRGAGKTTFVELCAKLVGGTMAIRPGMAVDRVMAVLLSPSARNKRVALFDNLKAFRFSNDFFESLIMCEDINGHRLNHGHASRPNYLTVAVTVNGASYSKDMAERSVVIKLNKPKRSGAWYKETLELVEQHRDEIVADVRWHLTRKRKPLKKYDRWEVWCEDVLARLPDADTLIGLLEQRRKEIDEDDQASADYAQHLAACVRGHGTGSDPNKAHVFIPSPLMLQWLRVMKPDLDLKQMAGLVTQHLSDRVSKKSFNTGRGYVWTGKNADPALPLIKFQYEVKPRH
jgi:hypothetical protein